MAYVLIGDYVSSSATSWNHTLFITPVRASSMLTTAQRLGFCSRSRYQPPPPPPDPPHSHDSTLHQQAENERNGVRCRIRMIDKSNIQYETEYYGGSYDDFQHSIVF